MDKKIIILLVGDKPESISGLKNLLDHPDRVFLTAGSIKECETIALQEDIDLVIFDIQGAAMKGFEMDQILPNRAGNVPVIFILTDKAEKLPGVKAVEEGIIDYLFKPLDPEDIRMKVFAFLKLIKKNRALEAENQQLKATLKDNLIQLEAANKELESFSYSVSHDLRAPLRSLDGYTKILLEEYLDKLDDDGKRYLNYILKNARKMGRLIEDLLNFSRLGRKEIQKSEIAVEKLVKHTIAELTKPVARQPDVTVKTLVPAQADYPLLTQVWINLLSNAFKYSSKKEHPEIEVGCYRENGQIIYYVKDNGVGFDMKYADKLFGVFQRMHKPEEFEGTGVGLAVVQRIVSRHGGRVWADAKPNEGATFYFSLPDIRTIENAH